VKLKDSVRKQPIYYLLIVVLFFIGMAFLPAESILTAIFSKGDYKYLSYFLFRPIFTAGFVIFSVKCGFSSIYTHKFSPKKLLYALPILVIAINNFPFFSYFNGNFAIFVEDFQIGYLLAVLMIVISEEVVFRGIVFPLLLIRFENDKYRYIKSLIISALIFAVVHIFNIFGGGNIGYNLLQVLYSFAIGAVFSFLMAKTGNILIPTVIHYVYNLGGMLSSFSLTYGYAFSTGQIILTAVVAVIFGLLLAYFIIFKTKNEEILESLPFLKNFDENSL